jgi:hypothetical protein
MSDNYVLSVAKKEWNVNCRTILIRKAARENGAVGEGKGNLVDQIMTYNVSTVSQILNSICML